MIELVSQGAHTTTAEEALTMFKAVRVPRRVTADCVVIDPVSEVYPDEVAALQNLVDKDTPCILLQMGINELGSQTGYCQRCGEQQCEADNRLYCGDCGQALNWRIL